MLAELKRIKEEDLPAIASQLAEAVAQGDLSENAEFSDSKERQTEARRRVAELEDRLRRVEIIDEKKKSTGAAARVSIGSHVFLTNLNRDEKLEVRIVGSVETDPEKNLISNISPLGSALLGRRAGEKITIEVPAGEVTYSIDKIGK
jgi:transcription elongation factor GreA